MEQLKIIIAEFFQLKKDTASMEEIAARVHDGSLIKGTNMSILILAIFIASIGLNMNSAAVVIGAMLISPLMGVIMAIGYGMATYDTLYVKKSFFKLIFQVLLSVLASALYFKLSPISTASSELLARTAPTIWDVLIAVFGGLAGIIGITRQEKSNVIPGVAIATALMPPLCTAGYGLAIMSLKFFVGALYLFFINSFFICLASFIILKIIRVPLKTYVSQAVFNKQRRYLTFIGIIIIVPSIYMAYQSVRINLENSQTKQYIYDNFNFNDLQVISYKIRNIDNTLEIVVIGQPLDNRDIDTLTADLKNYSQLQKFKLKIIQNDYSRTVSKDDVQALIDNKLHEASNNTLISSKDEELKKYKELSINYYPAFLHVNNDKKILSQLNKSVNVLFPKVEKIEGASVLNSDEKGNITAGKFIAVALVKTALLPEEAAKLQKWIMAEAEMPVMLNLQLVDDSKDNIISGNGINW